MKCGARCFIVQNEALKMPILIWLEKISKMILGLKNSLGVRRYDEIKLEVSKVEGNKIIVPYLYKILQ